MLWLGWAARNPFLQPPAVFLSYSPAQFCPGDDHPSQVSSDSSPLSMQNRRFPLSRDLSLLSPVGYDDKQQTLGLSGPHNPNDNLHASPSLPLRIEARPMSYRLLSEVAKEVSGSVDGVVKEFMRSTGTGGDHWYELDRVSPGGPDPQHHSMELNWRP